MAKNAGRNFGRNAGKVSLVGAAGQAEVHPRPNTDCPEDDSAGQLAGAADLFIISGHISNNCFGRSERMLKIVQTISTHHLPLQ